MVFCIAAAVGAFFYWKYSQDLPDHAALANYEPPVMTRVHAADGSLLAEYAHERRLYLPIQAMPKIVVAAFLSAEDKNFYKHGGIDPEGIVRAVLTNAQSGKKQGASTITQQVAPRGCGEPSRIRVRDVRGFGIPLLSVSAIVVPFSLVAAPAGPAGL